MFFDDDLGGIVVGAAAFRVSMHVVDGKTAFLVLGAFGVETDQVDFLGACL